MEPEALIGVILALLSGLCFIGSFAIPLIVAGVVIFLVVRFIYQRSQKAKTMREDSQNWLTTTGTVITSRVEVRGGDHTSVVPRIVYEYTVHGQPYQNDQFRAGDKFLKIGPTSRQAYDLVDQYPIGTKVTVYYNPSNPEEAALERQATLI